MVSKADVVSIGNSRGCAIGGCGDNGEPNPQRRGHNLSKILCCALLGAWNILRLIKGRYHGGSLLLKLVLYLCPWTCLCCRLRCKGSGVEVVRIC